MTGKMRNMQPHMIIRPETPDDIAVIEEVTIAAFQSLAISNHTEQFIIGALRTAGALTLSLVAEVKGKLVGHVAFSPVTISDGSPNWFGLGPVSVLPEYQRKGIGQALIQEGLSQLKALGGRGCCLVGDPNYYKRFGFQNIAGLIHKGVPQEVFLALSLNEHVPRGFVVFHEGFKATGQQQSAGGT
jgi:putative acetyltransferase